MSEVALYTGGSRRATRPASAGPVREREREVEFGVWAPHRGVRPFHQKSTCLTKLTLGPYVVQIWSRDARNFKPTNTANSTVWYSGFGTRRRVGMRRLKILNPKPCLNPLKPQTLHPIPYTLHPTPSTLHPTPYTPHPTPYTLHPHPQILTQGLGRGVEEDGTGTPEASSSVSGTPSRRRRRRGGKG